MSTRTLSHSEIETLLDCPLKWDFSYGGRLLGFAIKSRTKNVYLRRGTAWGNAVAKWHETGDIMLAGVEIIKALDADAVAMQAAGTYDAEAHDELETLLTGCLADYTLTAGRLNLSRPEHELNVRIPSRSGGRSNRFRLVCKLDGVHTESGEDYVVEFKFRSSLSSLEELLRMRQLRWYAWAWREATGREPRGVIIDERLADIASPVRFNKAGKDGIARPGKVQSCASEDYVAACLKTGTDVDPDVYARLNAKRWHSRERILFTPGELDEAGEQLVTAARLVALHETGELYPIRNAKPAFCRGCFARDVCLSPTDAELASALFETRPPKRLRPPRS